MKMLNKEKHIASYNNIRNGYYRHEDVCNYGRLIEEHFELIENFKQLEKKYDIVSDDEIDLQLTIEEINALICYISKSIGVLNGDLLNVLKMAYMVGEEDLSSCINAVEKLQKQKEMLENGNC